MTLFIFFVGIFSGVLVTALLIGLARASAVGADSSVFLTPEQQEI